MCSSRICNIITYQNFVAHLVMKNIICNNVLEIDFQRSPVFFSLSWQKTEDTSQGGMGRRRHGGRGGTGHGYFEWDG